MEISKLESYRELTPTELVEELNKMVSETKVDSEHITFRTNKHAGTRVREKMLDIKILCDIIRDSIQMHLGFSKEWNKRTTAIDKEIKKEIVREQKRKERAEQQRQNRMRKAGLIQ